MDKTWKKINRVGASLSVFTLWPLDVQLSVKYCCNVAGMPSMAVDASGKVAGAPRKVAGTPGKVTGTPATGMPGLYARTLSLATSARFCSDVGSSNCWCG